MQILGFIALYLAVQSVALKHLEAALDVERPHIVSQLTRLFNINMESSIPTWYVVSLLFSAAILVAVIAYTKWVNHDRYVKHWGVLSLIFLYLSIDEAAAIHEKLTIPLQDAFNATGFLYFAWVIIGVPFALIVGVVYFKFLLHLPKSTRNQVVLAAALYIGGAVVIESISANKWYLDGGTSLQYTAIGTVEEFFEMSGAIVFIYAMLNYFASYAGRMEIVLQNDQSAIALQDAAASPKLLSEPVYTTTSAEPAVTLSSMLKTWHVGLLLYGISFALLSMIIFATPALLGTDDYYHVGMASQIAEQKRLALEFPWLPQTILNPENFVDHHLLFHLYLVPWVVVAGLTGAKLAVVNIGALVVVALWGVMRRIGVRYASLWALALFAMSVPFLYRLLMIRTQGMSLLFLLVAIYLLLQRRYRWLIPLAFAYTWLYNGFVLIAGFAAAYTLAKWIDTHELDWKPVGYTLAGIVLGLVINPYFPHNIAFIAEHLGAKINFESGARVGNEWFPYTTGALISNTTGALLALVAGFLYSSFANRKRDVVENTLLFAALITLFMLFRSRRFVEYFPAFALLFAAATWGRSEISFSQWLRYDGLAWGARSAVVAIAMLLGAFTLADTVTQARHAKPVERFADVSQWLQAHTEPGEAIFHTDWDDFTRLFYYNTHNTYLVGLDPTYLERADIDLWNIWVGITRGEIINPSAIISSTFNARYVVSDTSHRRFVDRAEADPNMRMVYRDAYSYVWEITVADNSGGGFVSAAS